MRKPASVLVVVFLTLIILGSSKSVATTTQWFPSKGTNSDFAISYIIYFQNGSRFETTAFDLYNASSTIIAIPSILKYCFTYPNPGGTSIANNSPLILRYSYSEYSSTTWQRTMILLADNLNGSNTLYLYYFIDETLTIYRYFCVGVETVDKSNFWTSFSPGQIPDYFDCSLGPGSFVYDNKYIIASITTDQIIAFQSYGDTNETLIAGRDGRVQVYSIAFSTGDYSARGIISTTFILSLIESESPSSSPISAFSLMTTIGVIIFSSLLIQFGLKPKDRLSFP
ncbi:MAG: hypothetical protein ACTSYB_04715 [Candidatus Helarchaeota archaeon]